MNRRRVQNVMIKPTHDCNMNCDYCFVEGLTKKYREQRMSLDILNETYRVLSNSAEEVKIIWHGGEPTVAGVQWYKDAIELSYLYSDKTKFEHSMQSNGLLINEDWIDLIKNYGVDICISFDGLFQDFRKKGTKDIVERNLLEMKKHLPRVGGLSVITEYSYKGIIDNYKYFRKLGVDTSFNYGINGKYDERGNFEGIPLEEYLKEYIKYFKYWINDKDGYLERSTITLINRVFGIRGGSCSTSDCRYKWVNINPDGSTSHCNRYFPEELGMGLIKNASNVDDLYATSGYKKFSDLAQSRITLDCTSCEYLTYCKGGCNSEHLMNSGNIHTADKSYCERFKSEFVNVYKVLKSIDIYNNTNLNLEFLRILNRGVYTFREIRDFLTSFGLDTSNLRINETNLHQSSEFKLFRVFNPLSEDPDTGHTDAITTNSVSPFKIHEAISSGEFRFKREIEMRKILDNKRGEILKILGGEMVD